MVSRMNFNNPVMQQYLDRSKLLKHNYYQTTSSTTQTPKTKKRLTSHIGYVNQGTTTVTYVVNKNNEKNLSTFEKVMQGIAVGSKVAAGTLTGIASIISAIKEVKAQNAQTAKTIGTTQSTTVDTSPSTVASSGNDFSLSSSSLASSSKAMKTSSAIDSAIENYKNTASPSKLKSEVKSAISQYQSNAKKIQEREDDYNKANTKQIECKNTFDAEQKSLDNKKDVDLPAKEEALVNAQNEYTRLSTTEVQRITSEWDSKISDKKTELQAKVQSGEITQEQMDSEISKMEQEKQDAINKQKAEAEKYKNNELKTAQDDRDSLKKEIDKLENGYFSSYNKAKRALKSADEDLAKKKALKEDTSLADDNQTLKAAIDKGNKALGAYAISY